MGDLAGSVGLAEGLSCCLAVVCFKLALEPRFVQDGAFVVFFAPLAQDGAFGGFFAILTLGRVSWGCVAGFAHDGVSFCFFAVFSASRYLIGLRVLVPVDARVPAMVGYYWFSMSR